MNNEVSPEVSAVRHAEHEIDPVFLNRWSPRAFSSQPVEEEKMLRVFECARWAASSYNEQPWRFVIARSAEDRARFVSFLMPMNQAWAKDAPIIVVVCSKKTFSHNGSPNRVYQYDAGTASGYMTLGAEMNGLVAHGMAGFDQEQARATLGLPTDFDAIAVYALGYHGETSDLPPDFADKEVPSGRRPVSESIMEGHFVTGEEKQAESDTANQ